MLSKIWESGSVTIKIIGSYLLSFTKHHYDNSLLYIVTFKYSQLEAQRLSNFPHVI